MDTISDVNNLGMPPWIAVPFCQGLDCRFERDGHIFLVWTEAWKFQSIIALVPQHGEGENSKRSVVKETILVDNPQNWREKHEKRDKQKNCLFMSLFCSASLPDQHASLDFPYICSMIRKTCWWYIDCRAQKTHGQPLFSCARGGHASYWVNIEIKHGRLDIKSRQPEQDLPFGKQDLPHKNGHGLPTSRLLVTLCCARIS